MHSKPPFEENTCITCIAAGVSQEPQTMCAPAEVREKVEEWPC